MSIFSSLFRDEDKTESYKSGYRQGLVDATTYGRKDMDGDPMGPDWEEGYNHGYSEGEERKRSSKHTPGN